MNNSKVLIGLSVILVLMIGISADELVSPLSEKQNERTGRLFGGYWTRGYGGYHNGYGAYRRPFSGYGGYRNFYGAYRGPFSGYGGYRGSFGGFGGGSHGGFSGHGGGFGGHGFGFGR